MGTASGNVTIKDTIPENTELVGDINLIINENKTPIPAEELKKGYTLTLDGNQEAKIEFNVKVIGYAGKIAENTAKYQRENEEEKNTRTVKTQIEDTVKVITTVTTEKSTPQKVILVLDLSKSMEDKIWTGEYSKEEQEYNSKLSLMKDAVQMFLDDFFSANPKNTVMLITYAKEAILKQTFTSEKTEIINAIGSTSVGTNIDAGLTLANKNITDTQHTSVILMTDGIPTYYVNENGDNIKISGSGRDYNEKAGNETINAGKTIKDRGVNLYAIGFGLEDENAIAMLRKTASENKCYETFNGDALKEAFKNISESITSDNDPIPMDTQNGKIVMNNGFKVGQNVEIYVDEYKKDSSVPYKKYTWEQFINLEDGTTEISKYDETFNTLTFDLGKYMESEGIAAEREVIIRFVSTTANTQSANNISTMSLINNDEKYKDALENNVQEWDEINKTEEEDTRENVIDDSEQEVENTNDEDLKEDEQNKDVNNESNVSENENLNTEINNSLEEKTTTEVIDNMEEKTETESKENLNEIPSEIEESNNTSIKEESETESLDNTLEVKE